MATRRNGTLKPKPEPFAIDKKSDKLFRNRKHQRKLFDKNLWCITWTSIRINIYPENETIFVHYCVGGKQQQVTVLIKRMREKSERETPEMQKYRNVNEFSDVGFYFYL